MSFNGHWYAANHALRTSEDDLAIEYLSSIEDTTEACIDRMQTLVATARSPDGLTSVWDRRGPPIHCDKFDGNWTCR